jgi:hypothetical protein
MDWSIIEVLSLLRTVRNMDDYKIPRLKSSCTKENKDVTYRCFSSNIEHVVVSGICLTCRRSVVRSMYNPQSVSTDGSLRFPANSSQYFKICRNRLLPNPYPLARDHAVFHFIQRCTCSWNTVDKQLHPQTASVSKTDEESTLIPGLPDTRSIIRSTSAPLLINRNATVICRLPAGTARLTIKC